MHCWFLALEDVTGLDSKGCALGNNSIAIGQAAIVVVFQSSKLG